MINLDRIECYTRAATPGRWEREDSPYSVVVRHESWDQVIATTLRQCNRDYIAAADPQTVLALCRIARAAMALADKGQEYEFDDIGLGRGAPNSYWEELYDALDDVLKGSP